MKFANMISMLHRTCRVAILMLCIVLLSVQPASANGDVTILFSDDFENDTLGSLPTIAAPDVGLGYSDYTTSGGAVPLIVQDPSSSLEARAGQYWDFINNGVGVSSYIADFTSQSIGTVTASLDANVIGTGANGGSLGMTFMQGGNMLTTSNPWGVHSGYLWSANAWLHYGIPVPTGISAGDVFLAYYDGASHKVMKKLGGTEADGAAIGGEGKWHTITLTQDPIAGSLPQFTLDGVLLEPVPTANEVGAIDGLLLTCNGPGGAHGYVDNAVVTGVPEPSSAVLLIMGLGCLLVAFVRRRGRA